MEEDRRRKKGGKVKGGKGRDKRKRWEGEGKEKGGSGKGEVDFNPLRECLQAPTPECPKRGPQLLSFFQCQNYKPGTARLLQDYW